MTASNNAANTILVADFENYNATERPLLSTPHTLRVHYVHSASPTTVPTLETKMRYAGVVTGAALVASDIEQTSEGWMFKYSFDPGDFAGLTGQVGVQITGSTTGTSTPLPIGLEWVAELQGWGTDGDSWDSNTDVASTGDVLYPQIVELPSKLTAPDMPAGTFGYEIYENETVYVYFEFSDWIEQIEFSTVPLGGFQGKAFYAGRLAVAEGLKIGLAETGGYARRKGSDISTLRTYGGTLRGYRNALHWDEHDFIARIQSQSVLAGDLDTFFERAGMRNPVVMIPDETEPGQAVYGILTRWEASDVGSMVEPGMSTADAEPYYDLSFSAIDARARRTLR